MTKIKGFTLIELVVAMGLLSSLSVVVLAVSVTGTENFTFVQNINNENTVFSDAFSRIDRHVRTAVEFPTTYSSYSTNDPAPTLIMKIHSVKADGSICPGQFDYVVYRIENNELKEIITPSTLSSRSATNQVIMTNLKNTSSFSQSVSNSIHRSITVTLTYEKVNKDQTTTRTRTQTMVARND